MVLQRRRPSGFITPCQPSKVARPPSGPLWTLDPCQRVLLAMNARLLGHWEGAFVSYWEWVKVIGAAFLIGCGMTAAEASLVWWFAGPL